MPYRIQLADLSRVGVLLAVTFLALNLRADNSKISYLPVPDWVHEGKWTVPNIAALADKNEGTRDLLYDEQQRPAANEEFVHVVEVMLNDSGVQNAGSLRIVFDAEYQQLCLHRVVIHRGEKTINCLSPAKVRVIQQEPDLADDMITGEQTAVLFVEGLRVGDVLEYAYTIHGANAVLAGHFAHRFTIQTGSPVDRERFRVVWEKATPLQQRTYLTDVSPGIDSSNHSLNYTWDFTNLPAIRDEDEQPADYEPYPYVEVSDFTDWSQVVDWALPLYDLNSTNIPDDLTEMIDHWQRAPSAEEKVRLALEFVQDNLRYTGIELGPDSYRPTDPVETFQKRFGDCKGKVVLLRFLLAKMGISSYPALVNSEVHGAIANRLPSPFAFNHVILQIQLPGKTIWVDPTLSHRGGALTGRYLPPYGKALVIRAGFSALTDVPRSFLENAWRQKVVSTFIINDYEKPARFTVHSTYYGASADAMRDDVSTTSVNDLGKNYQDYYSRLYPGVVSSLPLKIIDDRQSNMLTVEETYLVSNLWSHASPGTLSQAVFYADNLYHALTDPDTRLRKTPLALKYPLRREQDIIVDLPDKGWNIPALETNIEHAAFSFHYQRTAHGSRVVFHYECQTKLATVPVEMAASYITHRDEVDDLLSDTLQRPDNMSSRSLNWLMVILALFGVGFTALGGIWYWRRQNITPTSLATIEPEEQHLNGLGGWLLLLGFGLCLTPMVRVISLSQHWESYFSLQVWQTVAMPHGDNYHPLYGPLLIFELLANIFLVGVNLLALGLFFKKRRAFPKVFIVLALGTAGFIFADHLMAGLIPSLKSMSSHVQGEMKVFRTVLYALIWISYILKSRRVKATFVR